MAGRRDFDSLRRLAENATGWLAQAREAEQRLGSGHSSFQREMEACRKRANESARHAQRIAVGHYRLFGAGERQ